MFNIKNKTSGFTLLEILLVVGIISLLAGVVIVAINPSRQLAQVRDTERKQAIGEINKAVVQYYIDHAIYPPLVAATSTSICNTGSNSTSTGIDCGGFVDLSFLVPAYLPAIPTDPSLNIISATGSSTGYYIAKNSNNNLYLEAPSAELNMPTVGSSAGVALAHTSSDTGNGGNATSTGDVGCDSICLASLRNSLVAYYPLDSNVNDYSGNSNNGTNAGGAVATSSGKMGGAYSFNGSGNSYLSTSVAAGNAIDGAGNSGHSFTFSVWAKFGDLSTSHNMFIGKGTSGSWWDDAYLMFGAGGNYGPVVICLGYINSDGRICLESNISYVDRQVWHNWAVVHNLEAKTLTLYRDGESIATNTYTNTLYYNHYDIPLTIGGHTGDCCWASRFIGVIDEVGIWNRALSGTEIATIYNNGDGLSLSQ